MSRWSNLLQRWTKPATEVDRALQSERFFWWRVLAVLSVAGLVGLLGIAQVRRSSEGIRTAYEVSRADDTLRELIEANRHAEARLTGMKNPNTLRREAVEVHGMHLPGPDQQIEVD